MRRGEKNQRQGGEKNQKRLNNIHPCIRQKVLIYEIAFFLTKNSLKSFLKATLTYYIGYGVINYMQIDNLGRSLHLYLPFPNVQNQMNQEEFIF